MCGGFSVFFNCCSIFFFCCFFDFLFMKTKIFVASFSFSRSFSRVFVIVCMCCFLCDGVFCVFL